MARILVADDNSNVQKTVTLALAGLGMDVVSVNNGEAAVRKLSDFSPDLVLADIFMPVRSGYEVCEFIKKDARFSRVPVVLLVGAFDPLDEREAQRVGADGILKKPFVPPDPLITMVKTLLDRTLGERPVAVSVSRPTVTVQARGGGNAIAEVQAPAPESSDESSSPEFPSPIERVAFGEGVHPVAFGTLLETFLKDVAAPSTAGIDPVDDEQILTSSRDATLGDPIFWRNDSDEPAPEPQPDQSPEQTPEQAKDEPSVIETPAWKESEDSLPHSDAILLQPIQPLELIHEEQEQASPSVADSAPILLDQAAQAPLTVEPHRAEDLAENPIEWMATVPPVHSEEEAETVPGWDEPIPDAADTIDRVESADHAPAFVTDLTPDLERVLARDSAEASTPSPVPVLRQPDVPIAGKTPEPAAPEPLVSVSAKTNVAPDFSTQSASDTARSIPKQDWAELTASLEAGRTEPAAQQIRSEPASGGNSHAAPASHVQGAPPDAALVEAVVQRVLDKMRPQIVDIITKEFLRPIVQALVHREIEKH